MWKLLLLSVKLKVWLRLHLDRSTLFLLSHCSKPHMFTPDSFTHRAHLQLSAASSPSSTQQTGLVFPVQQTVNTSHKGCWLTPVTQQRLSCLLEHLQSELHLQNEPFVFFTWNEVELKRFINQSNCGQILN